MGKELIRYNLRYNEAATYVKEQLNCDHILTQELLKTLEFEKGEFFTLLPSSADLSKLYEFYGGCILPQNKTLKYKNEEKGSYTWIPTLKNEMSLYILEKLKFNESYACIFEDVLRRPNGPHLDFFHQYGFLYLEQIYYLVKNNASAEVVKSAIDEVNALWHLLFIVTEIPNTILLGQQVSLEKIQKFCKNTLLLVVGAYDGEGFVLWEPHKS